MAEGFSWIMKVLFNLFVRKILGHDRIQKSVYIRIIILKIQIRNTVVYVVCEYVICNL
jgi:hypothetical protein